MGGEALLGLTKIDAGRMDSGDCVTAASRLPVSKILCMVRGLAVYGPQKGASPEEVSAGPEAMRRYAESMGDGGKCGGPVAAPLVGWGRGIAFCGAQICRGIEVVLDVVGFDRITRDADLVITGEGKIEFRKVPVGVAGTRVGVTFLL